MLLNSYKSSLFIAFFSFFHTKSISQSCSLNVTYTTINAGCNGSGGSISLNITGNQVFFATLNGITTISGISPLIFSNLNSGSHVVVVNDQNGCTATVTFMIGQNGALNVVSSTTPTTCQTSSDGTLTFSITNNGGPFSYSLDGGPVIPLPAFQSSFNLFGLSAGNHSLLVTHPSGCNSGLINIQIPAGPGLNNVISISPASCPELNDGSINIRPLQGWRPFQFKLDNDPYITANTFPHSFNNLSPGIHTVLVKEGMGCMDTITFNIAVDSTFIPIIVKINPADTILSPGTQFQINTNINNPLAINYSWTPGLRLDNPQIKNPLLTTGQQGDIYHYKLTASTSKGCKGEGFLLIRVFKGPDIYVPTGFTPNGDGRNDRFTPFPVGIKSYHYFRVFNRWGQLVFSTTALHDGWDGKLGGRDQPAGTYVWMVEGVTKDDKVITKKGTITLIR